MAILDNVAITEAKAQIAKVCKDGNIPPATEKLIEAIITATLKQVKAGQVTTTVIGSCATPVGAGSIAGTGTGVIS